MLCHDGVVERISTIWETESVGSNGPNFLNAAALLITSMTIGQLKNQSLHPFEDLLGRIRVQDKNAPRTIDLDLIVFDNEILEMDLWTILHIALPVSEIASHLTHPKTKRSLGEIAVDLTHKVWAKHHPEIDLSDLCHSSNTIAEIIE